MHDDRITLKVPPEVHRFLKHIVAETGEKQYAVLHRLLAAEWARVQQQDGPAAERTR
jgi:hypothetical protein